MDKPMEVLLKPFPLALRGSSVPLHCVPRQLQAGLVAKRQEHAWLPDLQYSPVQVTTPLSKLGFFNCCSCKQLSCWICIASCKLGGCCKLVFCAPPPPIWYASPKEGYGPELLDQSRCLARVWSQGLASSALGRRRGSTFSATSTGGQTQGLMANMCHHQNLLRSSSTAQLCAVLLFGHLPGRSTGGCLQKPSPCQVVLTGGCSCHTTRLSAPKLFGTAQLLTHLRIMFNTQQSPSRSRSEWA